MYIKKMRKDENTSHIVNHGSLNVNMFHIVNNKFEMMPFLVLTVDFEKMTAFNLFIYSKIASKYLTNCSREKIATLDVILSKLLKKYLE
jgi:hypothetical protein